MFLRICDISELTKLTALRSSLHSRLENWLGFCSPGLSGVVELLEVFCETLRHTLEKIKHILMISHVYFSHGFKKKNFNTSHQQRDKYLLVFRYKNVAEIDTSAK